MGFDDHLSDRLAADRAHEEAASARQAAHRNVEAELRAQAAATLHEAVASLQRRNSPTQPIFTRHRGKSRPPSIAKVAAPRPSRLDGREYVRRSDTAVPSWRLLGPGHDEMALMPNGRLVRLHRVTAGRLSLPYTPEDSPRCACSGDVSLWFCTGGLNHQAHIHPAQWDSNGWETCNKNPFDVWLASAVASLL